jgi:L-serine deaminase
MVGPRRAARCFVSRRAHYPTYTDSLAKVVTTMRDTGRDMKATCQEAARGCLAVHVTECCHHD